MKRGGTVIALNLKHDFYNAMATYRLYRLVTKLKPDIIHSMLFNANFHARLAGMFTGTPVIIEEHGLYIWKRWYHILIDRWLANFTEKVIAVSHSVKEFLIRQERLDSGKVMVLYDCVDPNFLKAESTRAEERRRIAVTDDTFVIGTVGNLREEKGHRILLHAFKQALKRDEKVRLFIVGDGPMYDYLLNQSRRLEIAGRVTFLKKQSNIAGFLKALDLFVLSSTSEGLGIALIEAIAVGLPCIASNVGGIKEVAEGAEGVNLVRPNNPLELGSAMRREIDRKRHAEHEKHPPYEMRIRDIFTPQVYLMRLEETYNEVLKG
jgi:glycosyltransferase involved in cell wall biosynthesis